MRGSRWQIVGCSLTKRLAVGQMYSKLAGMRALWWQAFMEAKPFPSQAEVVRMYAAQYTVIGGRAGDCGDGDPYLRGAINAQGPATGTDVPRQFAVGRSCCPYTSEIMEDYISVLALYEGDEINASTGGQ